MLPNQLSDKLSALSRVLAKVVIVQLARFFICYETQRFITMFIRAHSLSLSRAKLNHSTPHILLNIYFNIILPSVPLCSKLSHHCRFCDWSVCMQQSLVHHTSFFKFLVILNVEYKFWNSSLHIFFFVLYILHFRQKNSLSSLLSNTVSSCIWETKRYHTQQQMKLPYFLAHKTHFFHRKMWPKFDVRLMCRG